MTAGCALGEPGRLSMCRDAAAASHLKLISIPTIFATSVVGVSSPVLLARLFCGQPAYATALLLIKCFAAGVIPSTSLVHVLPDAYDALGDCQVSTRRPWRDFPFSGLVCLVGTLLALLVDVFATSHHADGTSPSSSYEPVGKGVVKAVDMEEAKVMGGGGGCYRNMDGEAVVEEVEERLAKAQQRMVSQMLEIGIIFHSVIIGVTMGMSRNQCTIRPLVAALSFHQIFEGMGLGGCIAQAGFGLSTTSYMCILFSVTTPMGIILGMLIFLLTGYDDSSRNALISEGLLGSLSSGILIYMALVDLVAVDFFHNKMMSSSLRLKKFCYIALVLGSASMSMLALWA